MKIIDLLNKIANGEEVPKKIKIDKWEHDDECEDVEYELFHRLYFGDFDLNDEVEIIEEDKKIARLNQDNFQCVSNLEVSGQSANYFEYGIEDEIRDIVDKINEIIDYLNKEE